MSIAMVLHEAERTGAPRVGGAIAAALKDYDETSIIALKNGPIVPWLETCVGVDRLTVCPEGLFEHAVPLADRIERAKAVLADVDADVVYVNSAAASVFVIAAKMLGKTAILHVHEKAAELKHLMRHNLAKVEVFALADAVVLAAEGIRADILEVCGFVPERVHNFGIAIDVSAVRELAREANAPARNARGRRLKWGTRFTIGMCGHASPRKGSDIFFETAAAVPEFDFIWIGDWAPEHSIENGAYKNFNAQLLPNFYASGPVDNPYKYLSKLNMFFLSSRDDPNPLVVAESLVLRVPVFCFSRTTAVANFLGRSAIVCHGFPNAKDSCRVLRAIDPVEVVSETFRALNDEVLDRFDIGKKVGSLVALIKGLSVVGAAA